MPFSTFDVDNDNRDGDFAESSCARLYKGYIDFSGRQQKFDFRQQQIYVNLLEHKTITSLIYREVGGTAIVTIPTSTVGTWEAFIEALPMASTGTLGRDITTL